MQAQFQGLAGALHRCEKIPFRPAADRFPHEWPALLPGNVACKRRLQVEIDDRDALTVGALARTAEWAARSGLAGRRPPAGQSGDGRKARWRNPAATRGAREWD